MLFIPWKWMKPPPREKPANMPEKGGFVEHVFLLFVEIVSYLYFQYHYLKILVVVLVWK